MILFGTPSRPEGLGCSVFALRAIRPLASKSKRGPALKRHIKQLDQAMTGTPRQVMSMCKLFDILLDPLASNPFVPKVRKTRLPSFDSRQPRGKLVAVAEGEVPNNSEK